jgi:hypothetical protein
MWKANDILNHFLSRAPWVNRRETVDRVIAGDPARPVDRCLVTWMPSLAALRQAVARIFPLSYVTSLSSTTTGTIIRKEKRMRTRKCGSSVNMT